MSGDVTIRSVAGAQPTLQLQIPHAMGSRRGSSLLHRPGGGMGMVHFTTRTSSPRGSCGGSGPLFVPEPSDRRRWESRKADVFRFERRKIIEVVGFLTRRALRQRASQGNQRNSPRQRMGFGQWEGDPQASN